MSERITRSFHRLRNIASLVNSGGDLAALLDHIVQGAGGFAANVLSDAQRDLSDAGPHRPDLRLALDSGQK